MNILRTYPQAPGIDSASNRNEYQAYFLGGKIGRCLWLTTLPPSCVDCLEIWVPQPPGTRWASQPCNGIALSSLIPRQDLRTFLFTLEVYETASVV